MASSGILVFIFTALCVAAVKSGGFINVQCKVENVGFHGQQSLLECIIRRTKDVHDPIIRVVSWKKLTSPKDENSLPLVVFAKGKLEKMPGYRFADPYWDEKNMNVSLLITKTAVADEGLYNCMVITDSGDDKAVTTLKVQAFPGFINMECKAENVGHHGQQSLLECMIRTTKDAQDPTIWIVAWKKLTTPEDSDGLTVFTYARGELDQKSGYRFAETSWNEKNMNVSLLITNTAVADNGVYRCTVITDSGNHTSVTTLKVHEAGGAPGLGHTPRVAALLVGIGLLIVEWLVALLFYRR